MNKYLEMLDRIASETENRDFSHDGNYDATQDKEIFQSIGVSSLYSSNDIETLFANIINGGTFIALTIDCETNEIDFISYIDANENMIDFEVRQLILNNLAADELEIYHNKCKAVIDKAIEVFKEQKQIQEGKYRDWLSMH